MGLFMSEDTKDAFASSVEEELSFRGEEPRRVECSSNAFCDTCAHDGIEGVEERHAVADDELARKPLERRDVCCELSRLGPDRRPPRLQSRHHLSHSSCNIQYPFLLLLSLLLMLPCIWFSFCC